MSQLSFTPQVCEAGPFRGYAKLHWIRAAAESRRDEKVGSLFHHLGVDNLRQAFRELDGSRASGVDGVTKQKYHVKLEDNLRALHSTIRCGGWRPRPGFRRGKSAHQALGRLRSVINARRKQCVVVEMDIEKFFNSVDHEWLLQKLKLKIADEHFLRLISRMLRGSILHEDGSLAESELGTPQGSPVSPMLANICLHHLLDGWFDAEFAGQGEFVRYADDAVFVFTDADAAQRFQTALQTRLQEAGLSLNIAKSAIVPFSSSAPKGVVSFLGFDFFWGKDRDGGRLLKLKTAAKRLHRSMQTFTDWVKDARNSKPLRQLWVDAAARLRGHFSYYGVCSNEAKLHHFHFVCIGVLFKWLNRRSQKRSFTWAKFKRKLHFNPLPLPPRGDELIDLTSEHHAARKHQPKSRMREIRTSGSERSLNRSIGRLRFT